jgi:hypothetical protein
VYLTKNVCLISFYAFLRNILHSNNYLVSHTPEAHRNAYRTLQTCLVLLFYFQQNLNKSTDFSTTWKYQVYKIISATLRLHAERRKDMVKPVGADVQCLNAIKNTTIRSLCLTQHFFYFCVFKSEFHTANNYNSNKHVPKLFIFRHFNTKICMTGQEKCVDFLW